MSITESSAQYFKQVAGQWDNLRSGYFSEAIRNAAIAKAYLRKEMVVADIGAGTGFLSAGLAPLVRKVYAVDGSPDMLEVARKNLAEFKNVEYHESDGLHLPFPDESLDAVFANMYLHHVPDPIGAIQEMVRVLVPGGRLMITDLDQHTYTWMKEEMADEWLGFERQQIRAWFEQVDLVNIIVDCTGQSCCADSVNQQISDSNGRSANISVFLATATKRFKVRDAVQQAYARAAVGGAGCGCGNEEITPAIGEIIVASSCCCSGGSNGKVTFATGYSAEELAAVPQDAGEISLGCGNPIAMAGLQPGEVVVDIGSGGGMDSFLAASRVGPQGKVIGVDMTPEMLTRARHNAEKNNISNVEFRQGQAEALPLENNTADVIISNCVINLVEDKGLVFKEAFRVLKPGGRLEVSDMVTSGPLPMTAREHNGIWAECISGALPQIEYLQLIEQAGFVDVRSSLSSSKGSLAKVDVYSMIVSAKKP